MYSMVAIYLMVTAYGPIFNTRYLYTVTILYVTKTRTSERGESLLVEERSQIFISSSYTQRASSAQGYRCNGYPDVVIYRTL